MIFVYSLVLCCVAYCILVSSLIVLYIQSSDVSSGCVNGSQQDLFKGMKWLVIFKLSAMQIILRANE